MVLVGEVVAVAFGYQYRDLVSALRYNVTVLLYQWGWQDSSVVECLPKD